MQVRGRARVCAAGPEGEWEAESEGEAGRVGADVQEVRGVSLAGGGMRVTGRMQVGGAGPGSAIWAGGLRAGAPGVEEAGAL